MTPLSSRHYLKRVWRVPKDRGASDYLAALVVKALRKHGWPASIRKSEFDPVSFVIFYDHPEGREAGDDFWGAVSIAVRIMARTYRVDASEGFGVVTLNRYYAITAGGHFREEK